MPQNPTNQTINMTTYLGWYILKLLQDFKNILYIIDILIRFIGNHNPDKKKTHHSKIFIRAIDLIYSQTNLQLNDNFMGSAHLL